MMWRPAVLLPLILTLWACAEGGSRGSGITTVVTGNVATVDAPDSVGVDGIRVGVAGTAAHGTTDSSGQFSITGSFEGWIRLVFHVPDGNGTAHVALNVPAGGTLTLNNVALDTAQGTATAETQGVYFDGTITGIDCSAGTLSLVSTHHTPDDVDKYVLQLDTSTVRTADGVTLTCEEISIGAEGTIQGFVNPDGTFGDATVDLD
jgi:hypothetical protein